MKRLQIRFSQRFGFIGGLAFTIVILVAHVYYANRTERVLRERLIEKATFINTFLAFPFSLAISTKDDVSLVQITEQLEKQPEVLSVILADYQGEIRYSADQTKIGEPVEDPLIKKVMQSGQAEIDMYNTANGPAMAFTAPLMIAGRAKPLGVVRTDMTFKRIQEKMSQMRDGFFMYAIGVYILCMTLTLTALRHWVSMPILMLKGYLQRLTPGTAEANLPEGNDEFGQLNTALNELILKFKTEIQNISMQQQSQGIQEGDLIRQLLTTLEPEARLVLADKDNQIVTDTDPDSTTLGAHLLDLMHDTVFGALVGKAFELEGQPAKGAVTLNDVVYQTTVLRLPESFSKGIRTLILLQKNKETPNT